MYWGTNARACFTFFDPNFLHWINLSDYLCCIHIVSDYFQPQVTLTGKELLTVRGSFPEVEVLFPAVQGLQETGIPSECTALAATLKPSLQQ